MFTQLHLKHFKAWRAPVNVELRDVTVLLGTNSSGKSSLLQSLLLPHFSAFPTRRTWPGSGRTARAPSHLQTSHSRFGDIPPEGVIIRRESGDWLRDRAKLVQPQFVQMIDQHWSRRAIEWNQLRLDDEQACA